MLNFILKWTWKKIFIMIVVWMKRNEKKNLVLQLTLCTIRCSWTNAPIERANPHETHWIRSHRHFTWVNRVPIEQCSESYFSSFFSRKTLTTKNFISFLISVDHYFLTKKRPRNMTEHWVRFVNTWNGSRN